jgi:hypothetical protein
MAFDPNQSQVPAPQEAADTAQQNVFARIGNTVRGAYDAFQRSRERNQALVQATLALGGGLAGATALELAFDAGPVGADTSATTSLEQQCASVALARPDVINKPVMSHAGIRTMQLLRGGFNYPSLDGLPDGSGGTVDCSPEFFRISGVREQIKKGDKWVYIGPDKTGAWGNEAQHAHLAYTPTHPTPAYVYDECINGHFEKNRLVIRSELKGGANGHREVVGKARYILPVEVNGNCQAAIRSREQAQNLAR